MNDDNTQVTGPLSQMPGMNQDINTIDDYQPPQEQNEELRTENEENQPVEMPEEQPEQSDEQVQAVAPEPVMPVQSVEPAMPAAALMNDDVPTASTPAPAAAGADNQSLEAQNIFEMLGVKDGSQEEREAFLDELQEVIWEDFIDKDVELLVTEEELKGLKELEAQNQEKKAEEQQEAVVTYLEKLIPDLEEIMLEKALELKEDLFRERIADMKDYYKDKPEVLENIGKAEGQMNEDKWAAAAQTLNQISD